MLKAHARRVTLVGATLIATGLALTQTSAAMQQQPPPPPAAGQGQAMGPAMGPMMMNEGQAGSMMAEHQQMMAMMMADMKAMDKKLDDLVAKMDSARGTDKVDAIAAVVKGMVEERAQMRNAMAACPMMKAAEPKAPDADHAVHH